LIRELSALSGTEDEWGMVHCTNTCITENVSVAGIVQGVLWEAAEIPLNVVEGAVRAVEELVEDPTVCHILAFPLRLGFGWLEEPVGDLTHWNAVGTSCRYELGLFASSEECWCCCCKKLFDAECEACGDAR
jgi:hypothetical protein